MSETTGAADGAHASGAPPAPPQKPPDPLLAELIELRAFRDESRARDAARQEQEQEAERRRLADKGQIEALAAKYQEALAAKEKERTDFVARTRRAERDRALTAELAGQELASPGAAAQLARLWADDFECVDGPGGDFVVRAKGDYRPPAAIVAERLAHADYAHFVRASNRGGGGAGGGAADPTKTPSQAAHPATLDQAVIDDWKARGAADRKHIGLGGAPDRR